MILCIKDFKNVCSNQLIISIDVKNNRIIAAVVHYQIVNVFQPRFTDFVFDVNKLLRAQVVESKVFSVNFVAAVIRCIIYQSHKKVTVILPKDRVQVQLNTKVGVVVVSCQDGANWQFVFHFFKVVLWIQSLVLFEFSLIFETGIFFIEDDVVLNQRQTLELCFVTQKLFSLQHKMRSFLLVFFIIQHLFDPW